MMTQLRGGLFQPGKATDARPGSWEPGLQVHNASQGKPLCQNLHLADRACACQWSYGGIGFIRADVRCQVHAEADRSAGSSSCAALRPRREQCTVAISSAQHELLLTLRRDRCTDVSLAITSHSPWHPCSAYAHYSLSREHLRARYAPSVLQPGSRVTINRD